MRSGSDLISHVDEVRRKLTAEVHATVPATFVFVSFELFSAAAGGKQSNAERARERSFPFFASLVHLKSGLPPAEAICAEGAFFLTRSRFTVAKDRFSMFLTFCEYS